MKTMILFYVYKRRARIEMFHNKNNNKNIINLLWI